MIRECTKRKNDYHIAFEKAILYIYCHSFIKKSSCSFSILSFFLLQIIIKRKSYHFLRTNHYRTIPCFIQNPEYDKPIKGLWQQIMKARLHVTMALLRGGTHLLISDVDNVFSRFVPLYGFLEEGFDVYHG